MRFVLTPYDYGHMAMFSLASPRRWAVSLPLNSRKRLSFKRHATIQRLLRSALRRSHTPQAQRRLRARRRP